MQQRSWLAIIKRYLAVSALAHITWESLQLPLYTIWMEGSTAEIVFAVVHCTAGDLLIAMSALIAALVMIGTPKWSEDAQVFGRVALLAVLLGAAYTIFSEWLNTVVRESWAYSQWMPVLPVLGTGLSPLLQWLVIPPLSLYAARSLGR